MRGSTTVAAYRALGAALAALPEPAALAVADLAGTLASLPDGPRKAALRRNLARALGGDDDPRLLDRMCRRAFRSYARYWVEGARVGGLPASTFLGELVVESGADHLDSAWQAGKGVLLALPHVGGWEFGGAWLTQRSMPMTTIAELLEPREVYDYFVATRAKLGLTVHPLAAGSSSALLATLRSGGLVGLLCDRDIGGDGVEVTFFGEATTMPGGPATLALRTGAALMPTVVYAGPGRDHRAVIAPPISLERAGSLRSEVARVTQEIATTFEAFVRHRPEQWHVLQPLWTADRAGAGSVGDG